MQLAELLMARGLVGLDDIEKAAVQQKEVGGRLDDCLVALGVLSQEQLDAVAEYAPTSPKTVEGTGIGQNSLSPLLLKYMYVEQRETPADFMDALKLPYNIVKSLLDDAVELKSIQSLGAGTGGGTGGVGGLAKMRYALTERGRAVAADAQSRSHYLGPAPVSLSAFQQQILKQALSAEQIGPERIKQCFSDLVIPASVVRQIGPAVNSGRSMLLYGAAGNGKTSVATRVANIFTDIIFVPYCVEVEGQIIQVFDSSVHIPGELTDLASALPEYSKGLRRDDVDQRWVACRRPTVMVGGEFTLEMLDLAYSDVANFYEAPMHVKALNGTFIVDDFGRQLVSPGDLLNRWIVPMESRVDYFKLKSGRSISLPFDELVIFSTNMEPTDLIDSAFLRRIPYKIEIYGPSIEDYRLTFKQVAESSEFELPDDILSYVIEQLEAREELHLAYYQPKFITDHVIAACKYLGVPREFTRERVSDALVNLYVHFESARDRDAKSGE